MIEYLDMLYEELEEILGYTFKNRDLLETALTHSSYANDFLGGPQKGNERLEFLGDAILDAVVGYELFKRYPNRDEGFLTRLRAEIVCERSLGEAATEIGLNNYIKLGRGEENKGGRVRPSIIADAAEAVIAAVFLDGGTKASAQFVLRLLGHIIDAACQGTLPGDYKTDLQVLCQKRGAPEIRYKIIGESGPDHAKEFTAAVYISGKMMGQGTGPSKKVAQIEAARQALLALEGNIAF